jgi:hypothetical protein
LPLWTEAATADDPDTRLERLVAPPADPDFHGNLWERIGVQERVSRRRRRVAMVVAVAAALGTVSAAGVFAFGEQTQAVDRTIACPVPDQGGVNRVNVTAHVKAPPMHYSGKTFPNPALAIIDTGAPGTQQLQYVGVTSIRGGISFDESVCQAAPAIPLARAGLPAVGVYRGTAGAGIRRECWLAPTVTVRMHVTLGAAGAPVEARLAVRSGAKLRPVAYIEWTPTLVRAFVSSSCQLR